MQSVSIIVPAHNAKDTIERCLESLTRQYYPGRCEVILVDNRSTDHTAKLAAKYAVRIVDAPDFGSSYYARNIGLENSQSEIVAFTDSDCIADKYWVYNLAKRLLESPRLGGVGGRIVHIEKNSLERIFGSLGVNQGESASTPYLVTANAAYKLKIIEEVGFFDSCFLSGGDVDLSWRILEMGYSLAIEPKAVTYHFPRKNIYSFFMQKYKYGLGHARLFTKHKKISVKIEEEKRLFHATFFESEFRLLKQFLLYLSKSVVSKKDRDSVVVMTPLFEAMSIFANTLGLIRGYKIIRSSKK